MKCFDGSSASEALEISIPAVGEMTAYTLMSIFDTMMIGNYGGNLSLSGEITISIVNIFISYVISFGITSLTARCIGAKKYSLAEKFKSLQVPEMPFLEVMEIHIHLLLRPP
jgi:multidrug resistance protein, MATE family